jgi:hypothetical protein
MYYNNSRPAYNQLAATEHFRIAKPCNRLAPIYFRAFFMGCVVSVKSSECAPLTSFQNTGATWVPLPSTWTNVLLAATTAA